MKPIEVEPFEMPSEVCYNCKGVGYLDFTLGRKKVRCGACQGSGRINLRPTCEQINAHSLRAALTVAIAELEGRAKEICNQCAYKIPLPLHVNGERLYHEGMIHRCNASPIHARIAFLKNQLAQIEGEKK
jgi:RecJ-like exonuclease